MQCILVQGRGHAKFLLNSSASATAKLAQDRLDGRVPARGPGVPIATAYTGARDCLLAPHVVEDALGQHALLQGAESVFDDVEPRAVGGGVE